MTVALTRAPRGKKFCVACKEPIPADAKVCFHCRSEQVPEKQSWWTKGQKWAAGVTAILGVLTALSGVVGPLKGWWSQGRKNKAELAIGQKQAELGEYDEAFDTLSGILKTDPQDIAAAQARLDVVMLWIEDFRVSGVDEKDLEQRERQIFGQVTPVLEAGLSNSQGYRAADVVAHLGWLNWLKSRLISEEGHVEEDFQRALSMDPSNVYAHAMMGNWLLENNRSLEDAKSHFAAALRTGKAKTFVRECELGGLIENDRQGARAELIRVINQMRKDGDPIRDDERGRIHSEFSVSIRSEQELQEMLSAVPPDEAWATYQWVDQPLTEWAPFSSTEQRFIRATIDEVSGNRADALKIFRQLESEIKDSDGTLPRQIHLAVQRLSH